MPNPIRPPGASHFEVDWGGTPASFAEVSGLDVEVDVAEYRDGADATLITRKLPGRRKFGNVTLKRGFIVSDDQFFDWWTQSLQGRHERRDVTVKLMTEENEEAVSWTLVRALPVKFEGPHLSAKAEGIAIEAIQFCHEGITVQVHGPGPT